MPGLIYCVLLILVRTASSSPSSTRTDPYTIDLLLGTPIRPFRVGIDLSTPLFWFYAVRCNGCPVEGMRTFDPHRSFTYESQGAASGFVADFQTDRYERNGSILGYRGADQTLIDLEFHSTDDRRFFVFSLVTAIQAGDQTVDPRGRKQDGRIGLALNATETLELLFAGYERLLCLGWDRDGRPWQTVGQAAWEERKAAGGYTNLTAALALSDGWTIPATSVSFGSYTWDRDFVAQLAPTTSYLNLPAAISEQIGGLLGARQTADGRRWVDCDRRSSAPGFSVEIGGIEVEVKAAMFIEEIAGEKECELKIRPIFSSSAEITLGLPFLDSVATCLDFDQRRVSFLRETGKD